MELIEIAKAARKLIEDPKRWTRGSDAKDAEGQATRSREWDAVCWCAEGAIIKSAASNNDDSIRLLFRASLVANGIELAGINDKGGHEAALAAFDNTINYLEGKSEGDIERDYEEYRLKRNYGL